jgi:hypothetical protein
MKNLLTEKTIILNDRFQELLVKGDKLRGPNQNMDKEIKFISDKFYVIKEVENLRPNAENPRLSLKNLSVYCFSFIKHDGYIESILNNKNGNVILSIAENMLRDYLERKYPVRKYMGPSWICGIRWHKEEYCELLYISFMLNPPELRREMSGRTLNELIESGVIEDSTNEMMKFAEESSNIFVKCLKKACEKILFD